MLVNANRTSVDPRKTTCLIFYLILRGEDFSFCEEVKTIFYCVQILGFRLNRLSMEFNLLTIYVMYLIQKQIYENGRLCRHFIKLRDQKHYF
jgi:hypothetical protein